VDPLRDIEELLRAFDDEPASVDPSPASVRNERLQKFRDAASSSRRINVPDHAAAQQLAPMPHAALELLVALRRENRPESLRAHRGNLNLEHAFPRWTGDAASRVEANITERERHVSRKHAT
jgi:hypothetical protein